MSDTLHMDDLEVLDQVVAQSIEPVDPPAAVRARVMAAIQRRQSLDESIPGDHESRTVRSAEGKWRTCAPGVRTKSLGKDEKRGTLTLLLDLEPNSILAAHDHEGSEQSYVIRGSCRIGAVALYAGDFHQVDAGAHHGDVVASAEGCLLLLTIDVADAA